MARGVPGFMRVGAVLAGCALVAACTPDAAPTPTQPLSAPPASGTPGVPASPTPSATPTETPIERRQRLDWESAEKAYRQAVAESDRASRAGGTNQPSDALRAVATGQYLELQQEILSTLKKRGERVVGQVTIVKVSQDGGYEPKELRLLTCEDNSTWKVVDSAGKDVTPKPQLNYIQSLIVVKVGAAWKVSAGTTQEVQNLPDKKCRS